MAYTLPSIHGRQDFPAPKPHERMAPSSSVLSFGTHLNQQPDSTVVFDTRDAAEAAGIPMPPPSGWPTVGQVKTEHVNAFKNVKGSNPASLYKASKLQERVNKLRGVK